MKREDKREESYVNASSAISKVVGVIEERGTLRLLQWFVYRPAKEGSVLLTASGTLVAKRRNFAQVWWTYLESQYKDVFRFDTLFLYSRRSEVNLFTVAAREGNERKGKLSEVQRERGRREKGN